MSVTLELQLGLTNFYLVTIFEFLLGNLFPVDLAACTTEIDKSEAHAIRCLEFAMFTGKSLVINAKVTCWRSANQQSTFSCWQLEPDFRQIFSSFLCLGIHETYLTAWGPLRYCNWRRQPSCSTFSSSSNSREVNSISFLFTCGRAWKEAEPLKHDIILLVCLWSESWIVWTQSFIASSCFALRQKTHTGVTIWNVEGSSVVLILALRREITAFGAWESYLLLFHNCENLACRGVIGEIFTCQREVIFIPSVHFFNF